MPNTKELIFIDREWKAWQKVVSLWHNDMNLPENKPVIDAINEWGEEMAYLRSVQAELSNQT